MDIEVIRFVCQSCILICTLDPQSCREIFGRLGAARIVVSSSAESVGVREGCLTAAPCGRGAGVMLAVKESFVVLEREAESLGLLLAVRDVLASAECTKVPLSLNCWVHHWVTPTS